MPRTHTRIGRFERLCKTFALLSLLLLTGCTQLGASYGGEARVGFSATYSDLNPYGRWVLSARYGDVWCPDVGYGWTPFSDGNWVWTDRGWVWSSYEPYGWLVYHYGNWYYDGQFGWCWLPGNTWSPATVTWVYYDDYVCWAPTPPRGVRLADPWEPASTNMWNIVVTANFTQENVGRYYVRGQAPRSAGRHMVARRAPDVNIINRVTSRPIAKSTISREPMMMGKKTYYKTVLPPAERERADRHQNRIMKSREQYSERSKAKQSDKKDDDKKKNEKKGKGRGRP